MAVSRKIWGRASKYQLAGLTIRRQSRLMKITYSVSRFRQVLREFLPVGPSAAGLLPPTRQTDAETANRTGPINRPIIPKAIKPPITPERIRISGKSAPMRINIGRMTLSSVPTTPLHTNNTVPGGIASPVEPDNRRNQYRQRAKLDKAGEDH